MKEINVKVRFPEGLHARPASELVKQCQGIASKVTLTKGDITIDPKSILGIMSLGAGLGDELLVRAEGEDEASAIEDLGRFFTRE